MQSKVNAGKHVHLVDMHSALTTADLIDGIHPNASGYDKMAAVWYNALRAVPGSIGSPAATPTTSTAPPTASPTTAAPTSAPPTSGGQGCAATYTVTGQWQGGFQATVRVTAGTTSISGWTVRWQFTNGQTVAQSWSATISTSGSTAPHET